MTSPSDTPCQRWRSGRDSYRPAGEVLEPSKYGVELLPDDRRARAFVEANHYSASYVAARMRVGLFRSRTPSPPELVGVAVFSVSAQPAALPRWTGTDAGVELGRFVLLDDVPGNGESWFLSRAFGVLSTELPSVRAVLSYSDPMPRHRADGALVTPGHIGVIYQALSGRHVGRGKPETLWLDAEGRTVSRRGLCKLRNGERGADGVYRTLLDRGAPPRVAGEEWSVYIARALREGPFRRLKHPGNLAYVWAVGRGAATTRAAFPDPLPYPRKPGDPRAAQLEIA